MADVTPILIKDLAAQTTLSDTDYFIVGGADAKKITVAQMKEALGINELNTKLSDVFKIVSAQRSVSIDAQSYWNGSMGITTPSGYRVLSYIITGQGNRMATWDAATNQLIMYNQGGGTYSATITLYVNFVKENF